MHCNRCFAHSGVRFVNRVNQNSTTISAKVKKASLEIEALFEQFFNDQGLPHLPTQIDVPGRSDYAGFLDNGLPAGGLATGAGIALFVFFFRFFDTLFAHLGFTEVHKTVDEWETYHGVVGAQFDPCYHQPCDVWPSNIDQTYLLGNAHSLAFTMEHLAMHDDPRGWLYPNVTVAFNDQPERNEAGNSDRGVMDSAYFVEKWAHQDAMVRNGAK